jgi:hypothetical protein
MQIDSGVCPGVARISSVTSPSEIRAPSGNASIGKSTDAASPYEMTAPVRAASSRCPLRKSAWRWVSMTRTMVSPAAAAAATYPSTSRWGSTTTARPLVSSPIRYEAWERQAR